MYDYQKLTFSKTQSYSKPSLNRFSLSNTAYIDE